MAAIGRPTIVVGHSLGGCVAGTLAQTNPSVQAAFLEDPPWFFGEPAEWRKSMFPQLFAFISAQHAVWQTEGAPLATYLTSLSNAPAPMGGKNSDHFNARHLLSHASALQRLDNRTWHSVAGDAADGIRRRSPPISRFAVRVRIIQADSRYGAALLQGHELRLAKTNPKVEIIQYRDCGHSPHRALAFAERFSKTFEAFISAAAPA